MVVLFLLLDGWLVCMVVVVVLVVLVVVERLRVCHRSHSKGELAGLSDSSSGVLKEGASAGSTNPAPLHSPLAKAVQHLDPPYHSLQEKVWGMAG